MRYIDADKFAKQVYEVAYPIVHDNNSHERGLTLMGIAQVLDDQPTADIRDDATASDDVVKVVRCKYCKHYAGEGMYCACDIIVHYDHFYCYLGEGEEE